MRVHKRRHLTVLAAAVASIAICASSGMAGSHTQNDYHAKNIIVMISDGCGYNHILAANLYQYGDVQQQTYEQFPCTFAMSTYSADGAGYDTDQAWIDFDYVTAGYTDSAAAATAMSTGAKRRNGTIGVDVDGNPLKHAVEYAEELGKATGIVTSVQLSHATPAAFVAHNEARGNYLEIACEMIQESEVEVIMGCGHPYYDGDGNQQAETDYEFKYVGGVETWSALEDQSAGWNVDADHNGWLDDPWILVEARDDFTALAQGPTPKRIVGVAQVGKTLQQDRGGDTDAAPYAVPLIESVPTLEEMTRAALNVLDDDPDGFFLMVEGGAVDLASHANQSGRMIEEQIHFNNAVEAVVEWVSANSSWRETLLIVTSDHECGYLTRARNFEGDPVWADEALQNNGAGSIPGMEWNSVGHTNALIPLFAKGNAWRLFKRHKRGSDLRRGPYIDNASIAHVIFAAWDIPPVALTGKWNR